MNRLFIDQFSKNPSKKKRILTSDSITKVSVIKAFKKIKFDCQ